MKVKRKLFPVAVGVIRIKNEVIVCDFRTTVT